MQVLIDQRQTPVAKPAFVKLADELRAALRGPSDALWALDSALRASREAHTFAQSEDADARIRAAELDVQDALYRLQGPHLPTLAALNGPAGRV